MERGRTDGNIGQAILLEACSGAPHRVLRRRLGSEDRKDYHAREGKGPNQRKGPNRLDRSSDYVGAIQRQEEVHPVQRQQRPSSTRRDATPVHPVAAGGTVIAGEQRQQHQEKPQTKQQPKQLTEDEGESEERKVGSGQENKMNRWTKSSQPLGAATVRTMGSTTLFVFVHLLPWK